MGGGGKYTNTICLFFTLFIFFSGDLDKILRSTRSMGVGL